FHKKASPPRRQYPGAGTAYNPFSRVRSREAVNQDEEQGPPRTLSEAHIQHDDERERRLESAQAEKEFGSPQHANTAPSPASGRPSWSNDMTATIDHAPAGPANHKGSADISDKTAVTNGTDSQTNGSEVKHRGWVKKIIKGREHDDDVEEHAHEAEKLDVEERKRRSLKKSIPVGQQIRYVLFGAWINVLLVMVPVGFGVYYSHSVNDIGVFLINFIAIIPLAAMLSNATEELALRVGETLGGLLNASFGNAVELIVSVQALIKDEITIVKTSLIGSMLSNLLLVLGMAFFAGGFNRVEQYFNITVAQTAASLLALCIASLIIPTVFHNMIADIGTGQADAAQDAKSNSELSHGTAIILLLVYAAYLFFQLRTHVSMYNEPSSKGIKRKESLDGSVAKGIATIGANSAATLGGAANSQPHALQNKEADEEDDFEEPNLTMWGALVTLAISTTLVAFCSEFMVSSIDGFTREAGISTTFVGLILLPIVGNAAEHATAVTVAIKDKMDLSIGVAVGSSMQIALLVLPGIVVIGWIAGKEDMTLYFDTFQIAILFVAVLLVNYLIQDGKSHWLEGVLLMSSYIIISLAAWFYPDLPEGAET
ncbi:hypothetical protein GRF29_154g48881, partial [Pseudopithomyces chartarum]